MNDTHIHTRRMGVRGAGDVFKGPDGAEGKGEVGKCGHWDAEYDSMGYCRDEDCRRERFIRALHSGKARKLPNGLIVWVQD